MMEMTFKDKQLRDQEEEKNILKADVESFRAQLNKTTTEKVD